MNGVYSSCENQRRGEPKTLHRLDEYTGSQLMRLWGVPSWFEADGFYVLWNGVGIFVLREHGSHVELHMAMKKGERHRCREAVSDILGIIGNREVWAQIGIEHKNTCNLAKKMGFVETWHGKAKLLNGNVEEVILMKRFKHE